MSTAVSIQNYTIAQIIARAILRFSGWRTQVIPPGTDKYVVIGVPHTSNWDFILMLLFITAERIPVRWMGKDTLFRGPLGTLMRSLGGIPVNRRESTGLVEQVAEKFRGTDVMVIGITPEGTRNKTTRWRSGFYYIALQAQVPIVMGYFDYGNKMCGLGPSFMPTGDIQADFKIIRNFYEGMMGKIPTKQGKISLTAD